MTGHTRDRVMSNELNSEIDPGQPLVYQIRIKGHLGREWTDWFGGLTIRLTGRQPSRASRSRRGRVGQQARPLCFLLQRETPSRCLLRSVSAERAGDKPRDDAPPTKLFERR